MPHYPSMGAVNLATGAYEYPKVASKSSAYICPFCEKDVVFRKGKLNRPHFAHRQSDTPCKYYESPSETQIHKTAKMMMQSLLNARTPIVFYRKCRACVHGNQNVVPDTKTTRIVYGARDVAHTEHSFRYLGARRSADVALVSPTPIEEQNHTCIKYVFEVCHKHRTAERARPDPWFEVDALTFIREVDRDYAPNGEIWAECIRAHTCDACVLRDEAARVERAARPKNNKRHAQHVLETTRTIRRVQAEYLLEQATRKEGGNVASDSEPTAKTG
jgi:hypothetical protein